MGANSKASWYRCVRQVRMCHKYTETFIWLVIWCVQHLEVEEPSSLSQQYLRASAYV
jgi:hypothetical protein